MHCSTDKLWAQMLTQKYVKDGLFLDTSLHYGSPTWNSIFKAKEVLKDGFQFRIGNGESLFWYSPWTSLGPLCNQVFSVNIQDTDKRLNDIYINNQWQFQHLATQLPEHIKIHIQNNNLFMNPNVTDGYILGSNPDGHYTAKAGYQWLQSKKGGGDLTKSWSSVWKIQAPEKVRFFL